MNCDNCKKKVSLFVPYVTVFLNNFLHLLLNRCDVKLKPILIDCSVFYFTGFRFHAFSRTFPFCCCYFFLVIYIKSTKKNGKSYSFAIAIKWIWRVFHKTFHQMKLPRTYSGPWTTLLVTFSLVFMLWTSWK